MKKSRPTRLNKKVNYYEDESSSSINSNDLEIFESSISGLGLKTNCKISEGKIICEYEGEQLSHQEFLNRKAKDKSNEHYYLKVSENLYLDAKYLDTKSKRINHSCDFNCVLRKRTDNKKIKIYVESTREIDKGEELLLDYGSDFFIDFPCECKSKNCKYKENSLVASCSYSTINNSIIKLDFNEQNCRQFILDHLEYHPDAYLEKNVFYNLIAENFNISSVTQAEKNKLNDYIKILGKPSNKCLREIVSTKMNEELDNKTTKTIHYFKNCKLKKDKNPLVIPNKKLFNKKNKK